MKARILPPDEWDRLEATKLPPIWSSVRPQDVDVVVVEEEGRIIATMTVVRAPILESLWIHPEHRGRAGAARALLRVGVETARQWSDGWVIACADSSLMRGALDRLGATRLEVDTYMVPLGMREGVA